MSLPHRRVGLSKALPPLFAATFALLVGTAQAQYVGPSTLPSYSNVANLLIAPVDDAVVTLVGSLTKKVGSDKYIFSDGTADIRVEIDSKLLPATPITEKTRIRIRGEVEKEFMESPEIDVDFLEVLTS